MAPSPPNGVSLAITAAMLSMAWGFICGVWERFLLAPHRRFSAVGPAYFPAMVLALLAGCCFLFGEDRIRFFFALLMAGAFFLVGAVSALAAFHLSRWIFRTRFLDETKG
jgi:hypothetical protein